MWLGVVIIQTTPTRTYRKHSKTLPYYYPNELDAPALKVTQHHRPTQPSSASYVSKTTCASKGFWFRKVLENMNLYGEAKS